MKLRDCIKKEFQKDVSEFGKKKAIILYILFIMLGFITALAATITFIVNEDIGMILMLIALIMAVVVLIYIIVICWLTKDKKGGSKNEV